MSWVVDRQCFSSYENLYGDTPLMRTPFGLTQSVLITGVSSFQGCLIYVRYILGSTQCPHYGGCPYFMGVHKAGLHSILKQAKAIQMYVFLQQVSSMQ